MNGPEAAPPPDDWPPTSWGPYVALRLFAKSLVALDEPTMAEARRITSLDDVIRRARAALDAGDRLSGSQTAGTPEPTQPPPGSPERPPEAVSGPARPIEGGHP